MGKLNVGSIAFILFISVIAANSMEISLRQTSSGIGNADAYVLACSEAFGQVRYQVEGFPEGIRLEGSTILVSRTVKNGNYMIKVTA